MLALFIGLLGALTMMASMLLVALGIAGIFISLPRLGTIWFDRPAWQWVAMSSACLLLGFAAYIATACLVGWATMR